MPSRGAFRYSLLVAALFALAGSAQAQPFSASTVLRPSGSDTEGHFGQVLALSGDTLAVSSPSFNGGHVYLYQRDAVDWHRWSFVKRIVAPHSCDAWSIDLDGDTLVIGGCTGCSSRAEPTSVYIYDRNRLGKGRWGLAQRIRANFPEPTEHDFGHAVAVDGDLMAISDTGNHTVRTYQWASHGWTETGRLRVNRRPEGDFGASLGLSGKTLVVGAPNACVGPSIFDFRSEGVYTFELEAWWREIRHLETDEVETLAGEHVAVEGPTLAMVGDFNLRVHERDHRGLKRWGQRQEFNSSRVFDVRGRTFALARGTEEGVSLLVRDRVGPGGDPWMLVHEIDLPAAISVHPRALAVGPHEVVLGWSENRVDPDSVREVTIFHRGPIHADTFESGTLDLWESPKRKVALTERGLGGSDAALEVFADGKGKKSFVRTRSLKREPMLTLDFLLNANGVDLGGERKQILRLSGGGRALVALTLQDRDGRYYVRLQARHNSGPLVTLGELEVPVREDVRIRLEWRRATGEGHGNGVARAAIVGGAEIGSSRLATDRLLLSDLKVGFPAGARGTVGGSFLLDDIRLSQ